MKKKKGHLSYRDMYLNLSKNTSSSQTADGSKQSNNEDILLQIAINYWKIQKKIAKMKSDDDNWKGFDFLFNEVNTILDSNAIKVLDYTGSKYIEGMNNLEILSVEKGDTDFPIIVETIEPGLEINNKLIKKAKVIILSNN